MKRKVNLIFIILFMLIITMPYLFAHRDHEGRVSDMENRTLAGYPFPFSDEGSINREYFQQFENWLNDNLRGRSILVEVNVAMQYSLFRNIVKEDTLQGEKGWLFVNSDDQIKEYQHCNLISDNTLSTFAGNMEKLSDYLQQKGSAFYYFQCYSKEAIYPEMYNKSILQSGNISRTEQVINALKSRTSLNVIDTREIMEESSRDDLIYFQYVDLLHWNEKGSYKGYQVLMNEIHKDFEMVPVLGEKDYEIEEKESSTSIYGFEYPYKEICPVYTLKNPGAYEITEETLDERSWFRFKEHTHEYTNENCQNDLKILIVGDSYVRMFLKDDIAESFCATLSIDWLNIPILDEILEAYQPDIVVLECVDTSLGNIIDLVEEIDFLEE